MAQLTIVDKSSNPQLTWFSIKHLILFFKKKTFFIKTVRKIVSFNDPKRVRNIAFTATMFLSETIRLARNMNIPDVFLKSPRKASFFLTAQNPRERYFFRQRRTIGKTFFRRLMGQRSDFLYPTIGKVFPLFLGKTSFLLQCKNQPKV